MIIMDETEDISVALKKVLKLKNKDDEAYEKGLLHLQKKYPLSALPAFRLGELYRFKGRYDDSKDYYERALSLNPAYSKADFGLGCLHEKLKDNDLAIMHYENSLQSDPSLLPGRQNLANLYYRSGNFRKSLKELKRILRKEPDHLWSLRQCVSIYAKHLKSDIIAQRELFKTLEKLVELHPKDYTAWNNLGNVYKAQDDRE
eukprot:UN34176